MTFALLIVPITDDNEYKGNENFTVSIDPSSVLSNMTVGSLYQATVTIVDDDRK